MDRQSSFHQLVTLAMVYLLFLGSVTAQDRIEMKCNPSLRHRYEKCPAGYCCVRDEFLPTFVYCRRYGTKDDNCTTRDTESECPCSEGLMCRANIQGKYPSVYGRCVVNVTTTAATTTTSTTTSTPENSTLTTVIDTKISTHAVSDNTTESPMMAGMSSVTPGQNTTMKAAAATTTLSSNASTVASSDTTGFNAPV